MNYKTLHKHFKKSNINYIFKAINDNRINIQNAKFLYKHCPTTKEWDYIFDTSVKIIKKEDPEWLLNYIWN